MANDPLRDKLDQAADRADAASTAFYAVLTNNKETPVPVEGGTVDSMSKRIYDQVGAQIDAINAKADEAAASATSANASKNAAANSVTQANTAKAAAEGARDTAVQAKDQAQTAAQASQASAVSAQSSASNSSNSANQAANSANTASTAVNQAVQAKDAANVAKNSAQASATSAEASKNAAANSATSAQTGATNSQGYSQSALNYRNAAEGFKNEAKASETAAAASAASALDSKNSALQSKVDSQSASSTATNAAANASASASSAASSENVARNAASSALVSKAASEEIYGKLSTYSGSIAASPEWSSIPAHADTILDSQAQSLANRTELLNDKSKSVKFVSLEQFDTLANAISYAKSNNTYLNVADDVFTVLIPRDAPDLQTAFDTVVMSNPKGHVNVRIQAGHQLTKGLRIVSGDFSRYEITSEDATVKTSSTFTPVSASEWPEASLSIFAFIGCMSPVLGCLIDAGTLTTRATYNGYMCGFGGFHKVNPGCGVLNSRMNCEARDTTFYAQSSIWNGATRECVRCSSNVQVTLTTAEAHDGWLGGVLSGAADCSVSVSRGCTGQLQGIKIYRAARSALSIRRSFVSAIEADIRDINRAAGSTAYAIYCIQGGVVSAGNVTVDSVALAPAQTNIGAFNVIIGEYGVIMATQEGLANLGVGVPIANQPLLTDFRNSPAPWAVYRFDTSTLNSPGGVGSALRIGRDATRQAWIASSPSGAAGSGSANFYVASCSGAANDWSPWYRLIHAGNFAATTVANIPAYKGQIAIAGGFAYIAIDTTATSDWKRITTS